MTADMALVRRLSLADRGLAVVATTRADGSVHTSVVNAGVLDSPLVVSEAGESIAFVARGDARKLAHFRRSGRAAVVFRSGWEWVSVEGPVRIVGPDDASASLPALLRSIFVAAGGTHDDWDTFDRVMATEHRVAVLVSPQRITGNG